MVSISALAGVTDLLDEALLDPAIWPDALNASFDLLNAGGGAILSISEQVGVWTRVDPDARAIFQTQFTGDNPIQTGINRLRRCGRTSGPVTDRDLLSRDAFLRTRFFNEFMAPFGAWSMMVVDLSRNGGTAAINLSRVRRRGEFTPEDRAVVEALRPHFARSFWIGRKLVMRERRNQGLADFFEQSPQGVFILACDGRLQHANPAGAALLRRGSGLIASAGRLSAGTPDQARRLRGLVAKAGAAETEERSGGGMAIHAGGTRAPLSVSVTPIRAERFVEGLGQRAVLVCVTDLGAEVSLSDSSLQSTFGLSPAESRVARALFEGLTPRETAARLAVSFFTVRAHLASIFGKTGARRQADLMRLLTRLAGSPAP